MQDVMLVLLESHGKAGGSPTWIWITDPGVGERARRWLA